MRLRETDSQAARADLPERVTVGRVLKPHGLRGDVVVEVLSDVPERLAPGSRLAAVAAPEASAAGAIELEVTASRAHNAGRLLRFAGRDGRDAIEELRGLWLTVERAAVPAPPAGTYYHYQLVGCRVRDAEAGELGEVVDLVEDGGGLLLLVSDGARQVPVPFVASFLTEVDVASGRIELALPPGFLEACASRS
ncbi:MAG TPA: ribosome maturation factor RimM [Thermoanaerobaculia bacterium]